MNDLHDQIGKVQGKLAWFLQRARDGQTIGDKIELFVRIQNDCRNHPIKHPHPGRASREELEIFARDVAEFEATLAELIKGLRAYRMDEPELRRKLVAIRPAWREQRVRQNGAAALSGRRYEGQHHDLTFRAILDGDRAWFEHPDGSLTGPATNGLCAGYVDDDGKEVTYQCSIEKRLFRESQITVHVISPFGTWIEVYMAPGNLDERES